MGNLIIRADASALIGTGHIMRALALAQTWLRLGGTATLVGHIESDVLRGQLNQAGVRVIGSSEGSNEEEFLEHLDAIGRDSGVDAVVLDGYAFGTPFQQAVAACDLPLAVVDDLAGLPSYVADLLLNQNIYASTCSYPDRGPAVMLRGTRYALLRAEFVACPTGQSEKNRRARRVLVTLGGADPENATEKVLDALLNGSAEPLEIAVVIGANNPRLPELRRMILSGPSTTVPHEVQIHVASQRMRELMEWADIAVAAAGSTTWELARMGVPAILLVIAENQREVASGLERAGTALSLGPASGVSPSQIADAVASLLANREHRESMSQCGQKLVDGRGAERVSRAIVSLVELAQAHKLKLRRAEARHEVPLLVLANDQDVRRNAFRPEPIAAAGHRKWFTDKLCAPDSRLWVLEGADGLAAQVRYDLVGDGFAEIGFAVAPLVRGRGLGAWLLRHTWSRACEELGARGARGVVFRENIASARAFERAGFRESASRQIQGRDCRVFERDYDWSAIDD